MFLLLSDGSFRSTEKSYREGDPFEILAGGRKALATVVGTANSLEEAAALANSAGPILQIFHHEEIDAAQQFRMELTE